MTPKPAEIPRWIYPILIVVLVFAAWSSSWHTGLGKSDFAGHVGFIATLSEQLREQAGLHLWTSDWNSGSSLVFSYLQPFISTFLLIPFVEVWGPYDGIRIGDTFFLAVAGLSMFTWCGHLTGSRNSALVGSLVYVLHPSVFVFVGEVGQGHQPISMAMIPMLFLAWTRLGEDPNRQNGCFAIVASALLFYDMERFWLILPHAIVVYFAVTWSRSDARARPRARLMMTALGTGLVVAIGMGLLVAFPTLPALFERPLLQWHDLDSLDVFRKYYSFPHLLTLVDRAGMLAEPLNSRVMQEFVSLPGQWYQGIVALTLVGGGAFLLSRELCGGASRNDIETTQHGKLALTLVLFVSALLVAFGVHAVGLKHWLLFRSLLDHPPDIWLGMQLTFFATCVLGFLFVVAQLVYRYLVFHWPERRMLWIILLLVVFGSFLFAKPFVVLAKVVFLYGHLRAPSHFAFPALPFLLGTAACLVTPVWIRAIGANRELVLTAGLVALLLLDVLPYRYESKWSYPDERVDAWKESFAALEGEAPGRMLDTHHYNPVSDMLIVTTAQRDNGWGWLSWTSTRYVGDVIKSGFFDTLRIARARDDVREAVTRTAAEFSALANVRFVSRLAGISPPMPASPDFVLVSKTPTVEIYRNRKVLAYAQFYPQLALLAGPPEASIPMVGPLAQNGIASLTPGDGEPDPSLVFDYWRGEAARAFVSSSATMLAASGPYEFPARPDAPAENRAPCDITERMSDRIVLDCDFKMAGTLVIAEAWFPNWHVSIDGVSRPSLRLNHAFQGVAVPAGEAHIEFAHRPSGATRIGKVVSALSWMAVIGLWIFYSRRPVEPSWAEPDDPSRP